MKPEVEYIKFQQFRSGKGVSSEGELIVEKPVELYVNGILWITFMCTPNLLRALAVGFLYNEGVIESAEQVVEFHICDNREIIDVWLGHLGLIGPAEATECREMLAGQLDALTEELGSQLDHYGQAMPPAVRSLLELRSEVLGLTRRWLDDFPLHPSTEVD